MLLTKKIKKEDSLKKQYFIGIEDLWLAHSGNGQRLLLRLENLNYLKSLTKKNRKKEIFKKKENNKRNSMQKKLKNYKIKFKNKLH